MRSKKTPKIRTDTMAFDRSYWLMICLALCFIIVAFTGMPVFKNPQLEPDDFRYLHQVQLLNQDFAGNILKASVVENRWDHLWWIDVKEKVRFFRPTIMLSYWLDVTIYGKNYQMGLLLTNMLLYAGCVLLACLIFFRWFGAGLSLLGSSALFASFYAHGELMWYVAGRTDSLAVLFLLGGLALHIYGKERPSLRWWALPCFVLAAITKELTLVLPIVLFLHDLWIERRSGTVTRLAKEEWKLYAAYAIIAICILWIHIRITSDASAGYPYPYFTTPQNPEFLSHLWGQLKNYCANLFFATPTYPFINPQQTEAIVGSKGLMVGTALLCLTTYFLYREKKYWLLFFLALASWLPTIIAYVSERYLLLPSFALAGIIGLLLFRLEKWNRDVYYAGLILVAVWVGHQAYSLNEKNRNLAVNPRLPQMMDQQLNDIMTRIPKGAKLLILNMPGPWVQAQFTQDQLRIQLDDPSLRATIITMMPNTQELGADMIVKREGENTILLETAKGSPIMARGTDPFPWVELNSAKKYEDQSGIRIEILKGQGEICQALRLVLPEVLNDYVILKWTADPNPSFPLYYRKLHSQAKILTL